MTTTPVDHQPSSIALGSDRPGGARVAALAARLIRRGTLIVVPLVAGMSAMVVVQYREAFADAFSIQSLEALATNPAIRTLFGEPVALDDPGGFTVWRTGTPLAVIVGLWALLAATRITRGEESAGRWELLLAGRTRLTTLVTRHLGILLGAQLLVGVALTSAMLLAGTDAGGAWRFGAALGLTGAGFAALGTLTGQLVADRRTASGIAAGVLIGAFLLRMVADGTGATWLHWLSPFGLLSLTQPYAADRLAPLLVLAAGTGVLVAATAVAARGRDLGAGRVPVRATVQPRTRLLRSMPGFAVRRTLRPLLAWGAGVTAYFLLIGLLASSLTDFMTGNPRWAELAAAAGFTQLAQVEGYVAALFTLLAVPAGMFTAVQIAADAEDEIGGRFTILFSRPVSRARWAWIRAGVVASACVILLLTAGAATWAGTSMVDAGLRLGPALAGVLNALPVALLCLGASLLALGWVPQAVFPIGALPAVGGFLLQVFADTFGWPGWVRWLSPFSHVANVPATSPDWAGTAGILAVALVLAAVGAAGYARRDLRG
jgi:ABC-2 type transport system permease protein